jgi:acylphosphatase
MPTARFEIRYSGRVQGVGFRATTRHIARSHPVTGWVRNEHDGSVTVQIQGDPAAIDACLEQLESAMVHNITGVDRSPRDPVEGETEFRIAYL